MGTGRLKALRSRLGIKLEGFHSSWAWSLIRSLENSDILRTVLMAKVRESPGGRGGQRPSSGGDSGCLDLPGSTLRLRLTGSHLACRHPASY